MELFIYRRHIEDSKTDRIEIEIPTQALFIYMFIFGCIIGAIII